MLSEWRDGLRRDWVPWATLSGIGWCALGIYFVANVTIGPGVINSPLVLVYLASVLAGGMLLLARPSRIAVMVALVAEVFTIISVYATLATRNVGNVPIPVVVLEIAAILVTVRMWRFAQIAGYLLSDERVPETPTLDDAAGGK